MLASTETKIVYTFDGVTRVYSDSQECYKTSLDPNTWQWTGLALEVEPPQTADDEVAVAKDDLSGWDVKPFFVGTVYWLADGSKYIISEIGEVPPQGALFEDPNADLVIINGFKAEIQKRLDEFAATKGYDNTLSCCTYADSTNERFAAEGQYMKAMRDQYWSIGYQIISAVQAGQREVPTLEQLFSELGELEWPNQD